MTRSILIIGGGPAGIEAAKEAARAGAAVRLVSNAPIGGRAGWHSLLPSKVWLTAADAAGALHEAAAMGIDGAASAAPNPAALLARLQAVKEGWNAQQAQQLADLGVTLVRGTAVLTAANAVRVTHEEETWTESADSIIIATGSQPRFPAPLRPNGRTILAPRFASHLKQLPASVAVIGGGATGSEFAYLFNRLGVETTWIVDEQGVLPDYDRDVAALLRAALVRQGVALVAGQRADRIDSAAAGENDGVTVMLADGSRVSAAMAFVAIGRTPDLTDLDLPAAGLAYQPGQPVAIDGYGQTAVPSIYLVGDATDAPMIANAAMSQARVAARHAAGAATAPYNPSTIVAATYTEPQAAQVGVLSGKTLDVVTLPFTDGLKAWLLPAGDSIIKVAYDRETRRLSGAAAVGPHAADALTPVAIAIQLNATVDDLAAVYAAHPTVSELPFIAARQLKANS